LDLPPIGPVPRWHKEILMHPALILSLALGTLHATQARADSLVVTTAWLAERLEDPSLVIIHVGNPGRYASGHVPGARYLDDEAFTERRGSLYTEMPDGARLEAVLEEIGVSDDSRIVVYQPLGHPTMAARLLVTLDFIGLGERASILDGGLEAWTREGRPTTRENPPPPRGSLSPRPRPDIVVNRAWMTARHRDPAVAVLDARTPEFYTGAAGVTMHAARPGHIPGAANVPFTSLVDGEGRLRDPDTLRSLLLDAGVTPGSIVVTYCHLGQQEPALRCSPSGRLGHPAVRWVLRGLERAARLAVEAGPRP
jgi:thiosulfate/3-mercaptopyruvate sulfurtransferase